MQPSGLVVMVASVGTVTTLFLWCVWQVLTRPSEQADPPSEERHP